MLFVTSQTETALAVSIIVSNSVGASNQCRSAFQLSTEICAWVRLLVTYGHQPRNMVSVSVRLSVCLSVPCTL